MQFWVHRVHSIAFLNLIAVYSISVDFVYVTCQLLLEGRKAAQLSRPSRTNEETPSRRAEREREKRKSSNKTRALFCWLAPFRTEVDLQPLSTPPRWPWTSTWRPSSRTCALASRPTDAPSQTAPGSIRPSLESTDTCRATGATSRRTGPGPRTTGARLPSHSSGNTKMGLEKQLLKK